MKIFWIQSDYTIGGLTIVSTRKGTEHETELRTQAICVKQSLESMQLIIFSNVSRNANWVVRQVEIEMLSWGKSGPV